MNENKTENPEESEEIELYGDPNIASYDNKVALFLKLTYITLPIWGIITWFYFWNGSIGWFDRGYWNELQIASNTTYPEAVQSKYPYVEEIKKTKEK